MKIGAEMFAACTKTVLQTCCKKYLTCAFCSS